MFIYFPNVRLRCLKCRCLCHLSILYNSKIFLQLLTFKLALMRFYSNISSLVVESDIFKSLIDVEKKFCHLYVTDRNNSSELLNVSSVSSFLDVTCKQSSRDIAGVVCQSFLSLVQVCHGDIKSENVMVTSWNWLLLTDFASFKPTYLPEVSAFVSCCIVYVG